MAPLEVEAITSDNQVHLLDWCLGLGGETGEVLDLVKHSVFHKEPLDRMEIAKELGDVLWYLSAICTTLDMSMNDVAKLNLAKLQHRYKQCYSKEDSANRHSKELALKDTPEYKILMGRINKQCAPVNIIVVGPDGAGKTTLIERLSKLLNMPVTKCDYRTEDKIKASMEYLDSQIDVIYDRFFFPDDIIYSYIKQQEHKDYSEVESKLRVSNPVIIYVTAPLEELEKRSEAWADDYVKVNDLNDIMWEYEEFFEQYDGVFPVITINNVAEVDSDEYNEQLNVIKEFIDRAREIYMTYPTYESYQINGVEDYNE